jgi:hypothetical protein
MKRIEFLKNTAAIAGASLLPGISPAENNKPGKIRFAYLTDVHNKAGSYSRDGHGKGLSPCTINKTQS